MLISVCQGSFNGASAFLWHCNTNCILHSDEGHGSLPFLLSRLLRVRSPWLQLLQRAAKGALFAVVRCYYLRVVVRFRAFALFEAVYLPLALLLLRLQYIYQPCTLSRVYVAFIAAAFVRPRSENQRAEGQSMEAG